MDETCDSPSTISEMKNAFDVDMKNVSDVNEDDVQQIDVPSKTSDLQMNGNATDNKDRSSPIQSPCEIENMTVVDEAVEFVSSADEEENVADEEKVARPKNDSEKNCDEPIEKACSDSNGQVVKKMKLSSGDQSDTKTSKGKRNQDDEVDAKQPPKELPLLEKYWKAVKDDPTDFTGWTYLLQYVDQSNNVSIASEVYDDFLYRYPYCYGYWRKYADYMKKKGLNSKCQDIFERGVSSIPLSVDLWIHYLNYVKETLPNDENTIRKLFERSIAACGLEFRSDRLWDAFLKWELDGGRLLNVTKIFDDWLGIPTQGYVSVMEKFKEHVRKNSPSKIINVDEFLQLRKDILDEVKTSNAELLCDDAPPGEENPDRIDTLNEEETKALKEKIIHMKKEKYKRTQKEALARWTFEENIKRPYFHVKPLEQNQLANWHEYLDFEIKEGSQDRVILLFERCLIACALYEEFWLRFVNYLMSRPSKLFEKIREVFSRACTIHHPNKLNIHLKWAAFEEIHGNSLKAASILENIEKLCPSSLVVILRRLNITRRRGENEKVCSLYEQLIESTSTNKSEISTTLSIKYARFSSKILYDIPKAIGILKAALSKDENNLRLTTQLIDTMMCKTPPDADEIAKVFDDIIGKLEDPDKKLLFCQRKVEFLEEFSDDCAMVQKAQDAYESLLRIFAEKRRGTDGDKKSDHNLKRSAPADESVQPQNVVTGVAPAYYPQQPISGAGAGPAASVPYHNYPQSYMPNAYQSAAYPVDQNYGYQNWQATYGYNQQWMSGANPNPQANPSGGYNYMY